MESLPLIVVSEQSHGFLKLSLPLLLVKNTKNFGTLTVLFVCYQISNPFLLLFMKYCKHFQAHIYFRFCKHTLLLLLLNQYSRSAVVELQAIACSNTLGFLTCPIIFLQSTVREIKLYLMSYAFQRLYRCYQPLVLHFFGQFL